MKRIPSLIYCKNMCPAKTSKINTGKILWAVNKAFFLNFFASNMRAT